MPTGEPDRRRARRHNWRAKPPATPSSGVDLSPPPDRRGYLIQTPMRLWRRLPPWVTRWDFALVVALGALMRLFWLDTTSFLGDQAELLALARSALTRHTLLATGIRSSIGALNPPASVYALLPFALSDPYVATFATALANLLAVALLYGLADSYFGRRVAFTAALLYAVSSGPVSYSRFIWQQNLLAPVVILFFWTLLAGVFHHRRGWLGWNALLWGIAVQLHPTAAPLIALTLIGAYLERKRLRPRDLIFPMLALLVLFAPTLLWEAATHISDAQAALGYTGRQAVVDESAEFFLLDLTLPVSSFATGSAAAHSITVAWMSWLGWLMLVIFATAQVWLAFTLVWPVYRTLRFGAAAAPADRPDVPTDAAPRSPPHTPNKQSERAIRWQAVYYLTLAEPRWLALALLAAWQDLPLLVMLRHSSTVHPHYLLVVLPATYIIIGLFLVRSIERLIGWLATQHSTARRMERLGLSNATRRMRATLAVVVITLAGGQGIVTLAQINAVQNGAVAATSYGMSLGDQRLAIQALDATARQYHAQAYLAATPLLQESLGYLAATEAPQTSVYNGANCLVTADSQPVVTLIISPSAASTLAPMLADERLVRSVRLSDGASLPIYLLEPGGKLRDEQAITYTEKQPPFHDLFPLGYAVQTMERAHTTMIVHWSGTPALTENGQQPETGVDARAAYWFGASPDGQAPVVANYDFFVQPFDANGHALGAPQTGFCGALGWAKGIDVYSAITLPAAVAAGQA